ncbi:MAG: ferrochelatase [Aeromicrobium sp.]|nr:ferrochelatase [Aeromicrobium sp.]
MPRVGVLITGFGGPDCPEAVGPFMRNLMGREPAPELVSRVRARYEAIGGCSPLGATARLFAERVQAALGARGVGADARVGMRYWEPYIGPAVDALVKGGAERIVTVALSPFETHVTHGEYRAAVEAAVAGHPGVTVAEAPLLSALPVYAELHAQAARAALETLGVPDAPIVFSAHSLPIADVTGDDSYTGGLEACAEQVASALGLGAGSVNAEVYPGVTAYGCASGPRRWLVAYQSKGARGGEWLGPDTDDVIAAVAREGAAGMVVVPLGFATEHMETLYDLDIVAVQVARDAGIAFARSSAPDAHRVLTDAVADAVTGMLG